MHKCGNLISGKISPDSNPFVVVFWMLIKLCIIRFLSRIVQWESLEQKINQINMTLDILCVN